jgi:hypothetical protein
MLSIKPTDLKLTDGITAIGAGKLQRKMAGFTVATIAYGGAADNWVKHTSHLRLRIRGVMVRVARRRVYERESDASSVL